MDSSAGDEEEALPELDQSVVQQVILSHMPAIKHCYEKELKKDPALAGTVLVGFTVGARGNVTAASVKKSSLANKEVEGCMLTEIKTWIFPEPRSGNPVDINYPFKFKGAG